MTLFPSINFSPRINDHFMVYKKPNPISCVIECIFFSCHSFNLSPPTNTEINSSVVCDRTISPIKVQNYISLCSSAIQLLSRSQIDVA